MIKSVGADEEIGKELSSGMKKLGYKPFNNITVSNADKEECLVTGICPLCGKQTTFESLEEIGATKEVLNPNTGSTTNVNSCKFCAASRKEQVTGEPKRPLNGLLAGRVKKILEDKFNSRLIYVKSNLFCDPEEYVSFQPLSGEDTQKYKIKLKIIMLYSDIGFEDYDAENEDQIFKLTGTDDEFYAILKRDETGNTTKYIEDFLVNPERDALNFGENTDADDDDGVVTTEPETQDETPDPVDEAAETEVTEDTASDNSEIEIENDESSDTTDETEITDDSIGDDGVVTTEPETQDETPDPVDEAAETEVTEDTASDNSEIEIENDESSDTTDETEITDDSIDNEFSGTSEDISIDSNDASDSDVDENATSTESANTVSESDDGEIVIESDGESSSTFKNPFEGFFDSMFGKKEEEKKDVESETTHDDSDNKPSDDGEIVIELDESDRRPFSEASEELSETKESDDEVVSPITSEAEKSDADEDNDDEEEIQVDSLTEDIDDEDESEIIIEKESVKHEAKDNKNIDDETETNHKDFVKDESKKIYENDKKWYNNPVVFSDADDGFNEFMDEVDLIAEFKESDLGKVIYDVCKRTNVKAQFTINEDTFEIPVVDFESGVRIVCIDCTKIGQMKVNLALMERTLEFGYPLPKGETYRRLYLYSDALTSKPRIKATIKNLIKVVNRDNFDGRRIRTLAGNYTLFYTDSIPVIRAFEDENSSYPQGKPCSKEIGIIALRPRSGKHEEFTAKDFMNYLNKNYKMDMKNHNLYMVASARYIVIPDPKSRTVKYQITDYCELSDTILKDGLDHIIGAIIKEHKMNNTVKDPRYLGTNFAEFDYRFEFEFDASAIPSPSLEIWYDEGGLFRFPDSFEDGQGKCYIRVPEYRTNQTDGYRKDPRLFLPIPFSKMFKADIEKNGVNVLNDNARRKFIEQLGFVESYYPRMKRFVLNPINTMKLEFKTSIFGMSKVDLNKFFSGNGVYDGGYDNILFQKFINSSNLDDKTKNLMNVMAISKMLAK